ncbi:LytTR family DNA-binding domain-containing protein [Pelagicoccus sp. SDUM812003]|uniref:LytR/AlgR family response regulator transcription factor n=1 Tax=Pelagicoccus sp. SDUM812003 TaxID=3041267 RepID=UPI00280D1AF8|nr:LytTR family DNA-binding domain-containing protein [Pelagicoccus sp. SDUM812003]MDQ8202469.1 LytTR family DNA-binding domain-containing protein [Pelagicoccus sp. SDUM812003]
MPLRTLIVDDEALARDRLRSLLEKDERIELVGEAGDGATALRLCRELQPELLFLDIQMPEKTGIEAATELQSSLPKLPLIIFVTAYDTFALKAFDLHATDYLLKPFDRARFEAALDKAIAAHARQSPSDIDQKLASLLREFAPAAGAKRYLDRLSIKTEGRVILARVEDIDWIGSANNYVEIHIGKAQHLMRETLSQLETQLDPERFLRISRSTIVCIDRIREIQPLFHGEHAVILRDGAKLTASRSYKDALKPLLGK